MIGFHLRPPPIFVLDFRIAPVSGAAMTEINRLCPQGASRREFRVDRHHITWALHTGEGRQLISFQACLRSL
jgi:hypothetical protein